MTIVNYFRNLSSCKPQQGGRGLSCRENATSAPRSGAPRGGRRTGNAQLGCAASPICRSPGAPAPADEGTPRPLQGGKDGRSGPPLAPPPVLPTETKTRLSTEIWLAQTFPGASRFRIATRLSRTSIHLATLTVSWTPDHSRHGRNGAQVHNLSRSVLAILRRLCQAATASCQE